MCKTRDVKGLYRKARAGEIAEFTGISSPYEVPEHPSFALDTSGRSVADCGEAILATVAPLMRLP